MLLSNVLGEDLLRIKGIVHLDDESSKPVLVQMSGYVLHEFSATENVPEEFSQTNLVVIIKGDHRQTVQALFNSFSGLPEIDTPDPNAVMDNPLAIPGMG
ncbi:MAG: GTP-binding protein [Pseudomonadota bacterium]